MASTKVLMNGVPGRQICHGRGLRQGDPLSPLLFVLVTERFNSMVNLAEERGLLEGLGPRIRYRTSLYADDVVLFLSPVERDLVVIKEILHSFRQASSLSTNYSKSQIFPINCSDSMVNLAKDILLC